jgi:hypothetical protein
MDNTTSEFLVQTWYFQRFGRYFKTLEIRIVDLYLKFKRVYRRYFMLDVDDILIRK